MTRQIHLIARVLAATGFVLSVAGCAAANRRCVSSDTAMVPMLICSSWNKWGECTGHTMLMNPTTVCHAWECNPGYIEQGGECVSAGGQPDDSPSETEAAN